MKEKMIESRLNSKELASYKQLLLDENILFECNVIPQMIVNNKRNIIRINKKFTQLFGYKPENILGRQTVVFTPSIEKFIDYEKHFLKTKEGLIMSEELIYKKNDGTFIWVRLEGNPIHKEEQEPLILWSFIDISNEIEYRKRLEHLAMTDYLTTLYNRRYIIEKATDALNKISSDENSTLSIAIIDIDDFKTINDTYGHIIGDKVIVSFAEQLQTFATPERIIARWGGEEFMVLFLAGTQKDNHDVIQELCRITQELSLEIDGHSIDFTASFGLAHIDKNDETIDNLIKNADIALYEAKNSGKNKVIVHKKK
jgi:diguanylate cyclase (GGDEF)-like protein/PAS domain S-box-containing protein